MARSFVASNSDFMQSDVSIDLTGANTITVAFWGWNNTNGTGDHLFAESSTNFNNNNGTFLIDPNSPSNGGAFEYAFHSAGNGQTNAVTFPYPTAATWHQYTLIIDSTVNSVAHFVAYVDGISQTLTTDTAASASTGFGNNSVYLGSRGGTTLFNDCRMAEFAIWNVALSASDASSLASGVAANTIKLSNLVRYVPICGNASPEPDSITGNWTVTGTSAVSHPAAGGCGGVLETDPWAPPIVTPAEPTICVW